MSINGGGRPNLPPKIGRILPFKQVAREKWHRNCHKKAESPLMFSQGGRFGGPDLDVLYLGEDSIVCFWESGLGRDLTSRMLDDLNLAESDLRNRLEYAVKVKASVLRIFDSTEASSRRAVGAHGAACFSGPYDVTRAWAQFLFRSGADGILYDSTREGGVCLALFKTASSVRSLSRPEKTGSSYENAQLLAGLFAEGVSLVGAS